MIRNRSKNESEEEEIDKDAWMITFSDLLTLMLTFFVMLLTMSSMDTAKIGEVFGMFTSIYPKPGKGALGTFQTDSLGLYDTAGKGAIKGGQDGLLDLPFKYIPERKMREDAEELEALFVKFARDAETKFTDFSENEVIELKEIKVKFMDRGITAYLPNALFFKSGKAGINPLAKTVLNLLGDWVQEKPYNIKIEGHTDNAKINSAEFSSNWELSVTRAANIMRYFIENKIIGSENILAFGYSEFQPLVANDSIKNRRKNRRMELVFKSRKPK